ncbi:MAG: lysylphosphatidylglycerol synthase transmembrane domain-containing protein [Candidatus Nanoarchaeia archaeon]|nr:flippase-like domain-containing protein [Candidatus Haiyanarchaeum thermophilum]MCW1303216.1 flippase-like domain-containing protein [Candidatus Haiyanarchaeum thermophilum]MCW1304052.1 flippase-like domain-containing protein [Candidatus Haiyanarchaeum thermophilum]MCW1306791.1 flippase-like domain-containing protein [Candidatus Haiyanarchaeum thermophilum]MCW1307464.1 flippase-like domain-containing protein [Candidatus Haiyanarchaeum thermophilum]
MKFWKGRKLWIGLSLILLLIFLYLGGPAEITEAIMGANSKAIFLALIASLIGIFSNSLVWLYGMYISGARISLREAIHSYSAGMVASILLPFADVPGDIVRIWMFKRSKRRFNAAIKSSILCRICFSVPTITSLIYLLFLHLLPFTWMTAFLIWPAMICTLLILLFLPKMSASLSLYLSKLKHFQHDRAQKLLRNIYLGSKGLKFNDILFYWGLGHVDMLFDILTYFFSLLAIGVYANLPQILMTYVLITYFYLIPLPIPGGIGVAELYLSFVYSLHLIPLAKSSAAAIVTRVVRFWIPLLAGYLITLASK